MRRKLLAVFLCGALFVTSLAGCGSTEMTEETADETESEAEETVDTAEAQESDLYVEKLDLPEDFFMGADISSYLSEVESGVTYYDFDGNALDQQGFLDFLAECGVNLVRIRVWNDPTDEEGNTYGGGNCDLDNAIELGQYATNAGMGVLIDFHYSDFWADPNKQTAPKAWQDMELEEKAAALSDFTTTSLNALLDAGVNVAMVQVGNETTTGICGETDWENMCTLFSAGADAVRAVSGEKDHDILVAMHFTNPEKANSYAGYAKKLDTYGVDYDVFASSYYPYWHGTLENLTSCLSYIAEKYDKKVMVTEMSYVYTLEDGDGSGTTISGTGGDDLNYDVSPQGQANLMSAVARAMLDVGDAAIGISYWEPAWIPVNVVEDGDEETLEKNKEIWETIGSGWATSYASDYDEDVPGNYGGSAVDNEAWFDFYGHPLESAKTYSYLRTGTTAENHPLSVVLDSLTMAMAEASLPDEATVRFADGSTSETEVTWSEETLALLTSNVPGTYDITGTVTVDGEEWEVSSTITLLPGNYLADGDFEDGTSDTAWEITGGSGDIGILADDDNVRNGTYCLKFWKAADFEFIATQSVNLPAGTYRFGGYVEGGDCGDDAVFTITLSADGTDYVAEGSVSGWQSWDNPEEIVTLESDTEVTFTVYTKAAGGGWGAWDDLYIYAE